MCGGVNLTQGVPGPIYFYIIDAMFTKRSLSIQEAGLAIGHIV